MTWRNLDIKMPKMDGFELYDELKKKDIDVKVYFLTASELYYEEFRKKEYHALDKNLSSIFLGSTYILISDAYSKTQ